MPTPPTPPPLPPREPWQAPPVPVRPLSYGVPVAGRPGVLTAVAVLSIVLGSMGILASGATTLYGLLMTAASGFARTAAVAGKVPATTALAGIRPAAVAATMPVGVGTPLTGAEVGQVVGAIEGRIGRKLTAAQSRTLRTQLQTRGQMLIVPAGGSAGVAGQIRGAVVSNGTVSFTTPSGSMTLYPGGGYTSAAGFATGLSSLPNVMTQGVLVVVSSGVSFALAILLLVAGIATARQSAGARRLHLVYAYVKIPVGVVGMLAWGWLWYALVRAFPSGGGASKVWVVSAVFSAPALLGLVYPVALLIVMQTRAVRAYYASVKAG